MSSMARALPILLICVGAPLASAQEAPPDAYPVPTPAEAQGQYVTPLPETASDPWSLSLHQKYIFKVDLQMEVPIPLTDEMDSANAGIGFAGTFGWDLGFLLPTLGLGAAWNSLNIPDEYDDDKWLTRLHFDVGLVAEFDNKSIVVPVLGAFVNLNWWHVTGDVAVSCGSYYYWGCYAYDTYDYTTGFTIKAGADLRFFGDDRMSLGAGVLPSVTLSGGPFDKTEWWLSPYAAFTIRN